jgi:glyoxylase-like metal-dependent hydrolase (beta-lactamase superfamily II)
MRGRSVPVVVCGLSLLGLILAGCPPAARAQQPVSPFDSSAVAFAAAAQRASAPDDGLEVVHVQGQVFMVAGDGGNIAVPSEPIRFILNTDGHRDHVGGNGALAAAGRELGGGGRGGGAAVIGGVRTGAARIAHENVLLYMASNGDAIVFFRRSDVIAVGAAVDSDGFPRIDAAAGGSIAGVIATLNLLVDIAIPPTPLAYQSGGTYIVPGWGRVMDQPDVVAYRDMVTIVRDVVASMVEKGMTLEQIKAAAPTRGFTRRFGSRTGPWTTDMFVEAVYAGVAGGGTR